MKSPIDFYFDFSSPYGYLGACRIEALATKYGRTVNWRPILLGVVFKQTGMVPLTQIPIKGGYFRHDFERSARFHGIAFRMPPVFPIAAQTPSRIVLWAKSHDPALAATLVRALYEAFFRDELDISNPDVAADVAAKAGADRTAARASIDDPAIKDALKREVEEAIRAGVFGSPYVVVDGESFWGHDRFDQLERWLATGGF